MKLEDQKMQIFEMHVLRYQFTEIINEEYDANWLNIHIKVNGSIGKWQTIDACLLTWEIEYLSKWFEDIVENKAKKNIDFIEPNLKFSYKKLTPDRYAIRIFFELECRPQSKPSTGVGSDDLFIDMILDKTQTKDAAQSLKVELQKFPIREINEN